MFTGIIQELGQLIDIRPYKNSLSKIKVKADKILSDVKHGDSISVNGVCLTVTDFGKDFFEADLMDETKKAASLSRIKKSDKLNLERALKLQDRFGGHFISGHVDDIGTILKIQKTPGQYNIKIQIKKDIADYLVQKGSIAVDGISLTIMSVGVIDFDVSLIPETLENTNMQFKKIGDVVNIETDILGKYVMKSRSAHEKSEVLKDILKNF